MKIHNPPLTFKDDEAKANWDKGIKANTDPYGNACFRYASEWATRMEQIGVPDNDVEKMKFMIMHAQKTSRDADDEGITGFMYGMAANILSGCWIHGEIFRRWHNKDIQIGSEGDQANEAGTVLNPALLRIG